MASCGHEERTERCGGPGRSRGEVQGRGVAVVIPCPVDLWLSSLPCRSSLEGMHKNFPIDAVPGQAFYLLTEESISVLVTIDFRHR